MVIEELLGPNSEEAVDDHSGCICVEDVIDTIFKCWKPRVEKLRFVNVHVLQVI